MAFVESLAFALLFQFTVTVLDQEPLWDYDRRNFPKWMRVLGA